MFRENNKYCFKIQYFPIIRDIVFLLCFIHKRKKLIRQRLKFLVCCVSKNTRIATRNWTVKKWHFKTYTFDKRKHETKQNPITMDVEPVRVKIKKRRERAQGRVRERNRGGESYLCSHPQFLACPCDKEAWPQNHGHHNQYHQTKEC